jgi:hypothetical protein
MVCKKAAIPIQNPDIVPTQIIRNIFSFFIGFLMIVFDTYGKSLDRLLPKKIPLSGH